MKQLRTILGKVIAMINKSYLRVCKNFMLLVKTQKYFARNKTYFKNTPALVVTSVTSQVISKSFLILCHVCHICHLFFIISVIFVIYYLVILVTHALVLINFFVQKKLLCNTFPNYLKSSFSGFLHFMRRTMQRAVVPFNIFLLLLIFKTNKTFNRLQLPFSPSRHRRHSPPTLPCHQDTPQPTGGPGASRPEGKRSCIYYPYYSSSAATESSLTSLRVYVFLIFWQGQKHSVSPENRTCKQFI